jgi:hypothetical protein
LLVYRLTHSPFLLGVLNFSQFLPILVLAPWAGALADRFDRRRLLLVTSGPSSSPAALPARVRGWRRRCRCSGSASSRSRVAVAAPGVRPLCLAGLGYLASNTAARTRLQLGVREADRGRIMALWSVAFLGLRPFASLADGALAGAFGVRAAAVVLALSALAGAAAIAVTARAARVRA